VSENHYAYLLALKSEIKMLIETKNISLKLLVKLFPVIKVLIKIIS